MTDKETRFVEEYVVDRNGAAAAIRAGYAKSSARQQAYDLKQKPEIAAAIIAKFKELTISPEEAGKHLSDVAVTRLNDYIKPIKVHKLVWVRKKLSVLIKERKAEIKLEQEFYDRWTGKMGEKLYIDGEESEKSTKASDAFFLAQQLRKMDLLKMEIELEMNPKAYRDVKELKVVDDVEIDLVALSKAKEKGRIKKLSMGEHGPTVEMYDAPGALRDILSMNGKLVQKHEHSGEFTNVDTSNLTAEERKALLAVARKTNK